MLHLAVTESVTLSIMYDSEARTLIRRLSSLRDEDTDFAKILTEENGEIKLRLKNEWGKIKAKKAADKSSKGDKGKKGGKKGVESKGIEKGEQKGAQKGKKGKQ